VSNTETLTYLIPCRRFLLEKPAFTHLVKKFPSSYSTQTLLPCLQKHTTGHILRQMHQIQIVNSSLTWVLNIILRCKSRSPTRSVCVSHIFHACCMSRSSYTPWFGYRQYLVVMLRVRFHVLRTSASFP